MKKNLIGIGCIAGVALMLTSCATTKAAGSKSNNPAPVVNYNVIPASENLLFKTFPGCGVQIWQNEWGNHENTFDIDYANGVITVGSVGWWGGAFGCYNNGISNGATLDLSHIKQITFDAKASCYGTFYLNFDNSFKTEIDVSTNFKSYTIDIPFLKSRTEVLFMIGGVRDLSDRGTKITIQNIAFYDEDGNETEPKYN